MSCALCMSAKQALKLRIAEHKTGIRIKNLEYAMVHHDVNTNHGSTSTLKFWGIENISSSLRDGDIVNKL